MNAPFPFILFVVVVLVLITGRSAIPLILLALAPGRLKYWFLDSLQSEKIISNSPAAKTTLQQLQSLGFDLLGVKVEKQLWHSPLYEIATTSATRDAFGSIILSHQGEVMGIYFYTPLSGGGMVFTRGYSSTPEVENNTTSVKSILSNHLQDLWDSHFQRVEVFRQRGLNPLVGHSQESRLAATKLYYGTDYARQTGRSLLGGPIVQAFVLTFIFLIVLVTISLYRSTNR